MLSSHVNPARPRQHVAARQRPQARQVAPTPRRDRSAIAHYQPAERSGSQVSDQTSDAEPPLSAAANLEALKSNLGEPGQPVSGYVGVWSRFRADDEAWAAAGAGDIRYGFRAKPGAPDTLQVWKAEEADLSSSPKMQSQRASLPQLQRDPLQLQLELDTLIVEVGPHTPLMDPSFASDVARLESAAAEAGAGMPPGPAASPVLSACMRVLAVPHWGNLVITGALPQVSASAPMHAAQPPDNAQGHPEVSASWFNRAYLRMPGAHGGIRWSGMLHYSTSTGELLTSYKTFELPIPGAGSLQDVFAAGAHAALSETAGGKRGSRQLGAESMSAYIAASRAALARGRFTCVSWDDRMAARTSSGACEGPLALQGGPERVEVLFCSGGGYFAAPRSLHPQAVKGQDVVLELGAVLPRQGEEARYGCAAPEGLAGGVARWLLCYAGSGERRLKWARHEVWGSDAA